jgi:hypothetical protein
MAETLFATLAIVVITVVALRFITSVGRLW